jgi:CRP-like cAMP-binding protein
VVKWIAIGFAAIIAIAIVYVIAAYNYPAFREATRDIAIVILAIFQIIGSILTAALLMALLYSMVALEKLATQTVLPKVDLLTAKLDEVIEQTQAIAGNVKDTTMTVSTTTSYIADRVVSPVIRVSSLLTGVRAAASFLARRGQK